MYGDILFVLLLLIRVFVAIVAWPNAAVLSWTILTRTLKLIFWSDTPLLESGTLSSSINIKFNRRTAS